MAGPDGVIVGVAVDHRDSLRVALERKGLPSPSDEELAALKVRIAAGLAPAATLVLLDAEYGAAQAIAVGAVPGATALATPLEAQGYGDAADGAPTRLLPDWTPEDAARLGAAACKLLLPYRVDRPDHAEAQEAVLREALASCRTAGTALILEPIVYGNVAEGRFAELVVAGARRLSEHQPDVLKLQYPGDAEACRALDDACGPAVPWVLLGGGTDAETLASQVEMACRAGASGFVVGRTLWEPALVEDDGESERALVSLSRPLLDRLAYVAREHATPWRDRVGPLAPPPIGWHR